MCTGLITDLFRVGFSGEHVRGVKGPPRVDGTDPAGLSPALTQSANKAVSHLSKFADGQKWGRNYQSLLGFSLKIKDLLPPKGHVCVSARQRRAV